MAVEQASCAVNAGRTDCDVNTVCEAFDLSAMPLLLGRLLKFGIERKTMAKKQNNTRKKSHQNTPEEGILSEAWNRMNADIDKLLPQSLRRKNKKKFMVWLFLAELLVLGVVGKIVFDWWTGS
ncbi:MAG: hypothetical protein JRE16_03975 [Deltaproteobacteria bacterium]|jgi:hypothetical protein|nr:hypothetical protein [Deltaproteobacteria bacterium]MBW2520953.1 hypothetical protein [Deltaproteobacteria bacterium]